jgi:hypothetical protein
MELVLEMKRWHLIILFTLSILATAQAQNPPTLQIVSEDSNLPAELRYGSLKVRPVRLRPGTNIPVTIDDPDFFVFQHYVDFLGRVPDAPGLAHWTREITMCSDPANRRPGETVESCVDRKRENTSAAFFLSAEFQNTGYFVYRLYKGTLGRMPRYDEFIPEMRQVARGIVVDNRLSPDVINSNRMNYAMQFVNRADFKAIYDGLSNEQFVDRLFSTTGITPTSDERTTLIDGLNSGAETRGSVVFKVIDGSQFLPNGQMAFQTRYGKAFYDKEFNAAFVLMEYFGYLRRDPDQAGYDHWLGKLNRYGNFVDAQMVRAFIVSPEYRLRF